MERGAMKRNTWIGLGIGVVVVGGGVAYIWSRPKDEIKWRMAKVDRGNVTQRINATGAVSPVVQVSVGTQVSGVIQALYVDYNSIVKKGQLVAQIDSTVWVSQLQDAQASLLRAQAAYGFAKIDFRGRSLLFGLMLSTMMIPFPVLMVTFAVMPGRRARLPVNLGPGISLAPPGMRARICGSRVEALVAWSAGVAFVPRAGGVLPSSSDPGSGSLGTIISTT